MAGTHLFEAPRFGAGVLAVLRGASRIVLAAVGLTATVVAPVAALGGGYATADVTSVVLYANDRCWETDNQSISTRFSVNYDAVFNMVDSEFTGADRIWFTLVDSGNKVLDFATGGVTEAESPVSTSTIINVRSRPASGEFTIYVNDAGPGHHPGAIGAAYVSPDLAEYPRIDTFTFDPSLLDADCPGAATIEPSLVGITRDTPSTEAINASEVSWIVQFSEDVFNVGVADFQIVGPAGPSLALTQLSGGSYRATASHLGSYEGQIALEFRESQDIEDGVHNSFDGSLAGAAIETFTRYQDTTSPLVQSMSVSGSPSANADSVTFRTTFDEAVFAVTADDFVVETMSGSATGDVGAVAVVSDRVFDIEVDSISGVGVLRLAFKPDTDVVDIVGNGGGTNGYVGAHTSDNVGIDHVGPRISSVMRHNPAEETTDADSLTWRVTFDEVVTNVGMADFDVGALPEVTLSAVQGASAAVWDVTASGGAITDMNGEVTLAISASHDIADTHGNAMTDTVPTGTDQSSYTVLNDQIGPLIVSIERQNPTSETTDADTVTWRAQFSEAVLGVDASDFTITGTSAALSVTEVGDTGAIWDLTLAGGNLADLNAVVSLAPIDDPSITDLASNAFSQEIPIAPNEASFAIINDHAAPELLSIFRQTPAMELTNATTVVFRLTFDEPIAAFEPADLDLAGGVSGSIQSVQAVDDGMAVWDATVSSVSGDGTLAVILAGANGIEDAVGNSGAGDELATGEAYTIDQTPPEVSISTLSADPVSGVFDIAVSFTENVTGFSLEDIVVTGGAASAFTGSGTDYGATITPTADGPVTVDIAAAVAQDAAGIDNTVAPQFSIVNDESEPAGYAAAFDQALLTQANINAVSFTFSGAEVGADFDYSISSSAGGTPVTGTGTISTADQQVGSIDVSGLNDGMLTLSVTLTDTVGNEGDAAIDDTQKDATAPAVTSIALNGSPAGNANGITFTVSFDDTAYNIDTGDFGLTTTGTTSGTIASASADSGSSVTVMVNTISGDGTLRLDLMADTNIADADGNDSPAAFAAGSVHSVDNTAPSGYSVVFDQSQVYGGNASAVSFTFIGAEVDAIYAYTVTSDGGAGSVAGGGTVTDAGQTIYNINVSSLSDGELTLSVRLTDPAGNEGAAAAATTTKDVSLPGFTEVFSPDTVTVGEESTLTFTIDNSGVAFAASSLDFTNNFPAGMVVATPPNAATTCTGGALTAIPGSGSVTYSGGSVAAGASCTINVDVDTTVDGVLLNTTGDLTHALGNSGAASDTLTVNEPTISLDDPSVTEGDTGTETLSFTVTLSDASSETIRVNYATSDGTAVDGADYMATSGTLTFTPGDTSETVRVTILNELRFEPDETLTLTLSSPSNVTIADATGTGTIVSDDTDGTPPSISITAENDPVAGAFAANFTFSEAVTGFNSNDIELTNGTASDFAGSGVSYSAVITPGADGEVMIVVSAGAAQDESAVENTRGALTVENDETPPTVEIASASEDTVSGAFTINVSFSEAVTGLELTDLVVTNGTASEFAGEGADYTVVIMPEADGAVSVDIAAGVSEDLAGNGNSAAATFSIETDGTAPTLVITLPGETSEGPFTAVFEFSEEITGFDIEDISATNADISEFTAEGSGQFSAIITPQTLGAVTVAVAADVAEDAAGNGNTASSTTLEAVAKPIEVEVEVSEDVADVTEVSAEANITNPGSAAIEFRVEVDVQWIKVDPMSGTIPSLGELVLNLSVTDEANDLPPGSYTGTVTIINVTTGAAAAKGPNAVARAEGEGIVVEIPLAIRIQQRNGTIQLVSTTPGGVERDELFTIASSDADLDGLELSTLNGRAESAVITKRFGSYDATQLAPEGWRIEAIACVGDEDNGSVIDLAAGRIDIDLDPNEAIVCTFQNRRDVEAIRLATRRAINNFMVRRADRILASAPDLTNRLRARGATSPGRFAADIVGGHRTMSFETSLAGIRHHVNTDRPQARSRSPFHGATQRQQNMGSDGLRAAYLAGGPAAFAFGTEFDPDFDPVFDAAISGGGIGHGGTLAARQPQRRTGSEGAPQRSGSGNAAASAFDLWITGSYASVEDDRAGDSADSTFGVIQIGADWLINDTTLVGVMVQRDYMDEESSNPVEIAGALRGARVDGTGWMVGPYAVMEIADGVLLDVLAMYGQSENTVDPLGLYEDAFDTDRFLIRAEISGEWVQDTLRVRPIASLAHFEETQDAYVDSLGIAIPEQTIAVGRLEAGPEFAWRYVSSDGRWWEPNVNVRAVWDYNPADLMNEAGGRAETGDVRMDARFGLRGRISGNAELNAEFSLSGLGDGDFSVNGGRLELRLPF